MPIRLADVSRIAGLDLLHNKDINNIIRTEYNYKGVSFHLFFFQTECKNTPEKYKLSKTLVCSSLT